MKVISFDKSMEVILERGTLLWAQPQTIQIWAHIQNTNKI
jgi:hypothetical protein